MLFPKLVTILTVVFWLVVLVIAPHAAAAAGIGFALVMSAKRLEFFRTTRR